MTGKQKYLAITSTGLAASLWMLFTGGVQKDEMIVGAAVLAVTMIFVWLVWRTDAPELELRAKDLAACWRIPWYILSGIYEIVIVLLKDLTGIQRASSFYRYCGFKTRARDPLLAMRRVLATAYTTTAPNFIVIGIDCSQTRMLFHQLERSSIPRMTKELGAQPGAKRS